MNEAELKRIVALHECGHLSIYLTTCLRPFLLSARIFQVDGEWRGECVSKGFGNLNDEQKVAHFAECLAGPLKEIIDYPRNVDDAVIEAIKTQGGLLRALEWLWDKKVPFKIRWGNDLAIYANYSARRLRGENLPLERLFEIERSVYDWLKDESVANDCLQWAKCFIEKHAVNLEEILGWDVGSFPKLELPQRLFPDGVEFD